MDERADKDVSASTVQGSSKETASDQVASGDSEKTRVVEPAVSEVQVQGEDVSKGCSIEGVVSEGGGSCNGADTAVGVVASDKHVDGVCVHDTGDDGGRKLSEEGTSSLGKSQEMGSEGYAKDLVGGGGDESGFSGSKEASDFGIESEVVKSSGVAESKEEKLVDGHATITKVIDVTRGDAIVHDTCDDGGSMLSEEGPSSLGKSREMGLEGDTKDLVGGGDESGLSGSKETSNFGTEGEFVKSHGVAESKEDKMADDHTTIGKVTDVTRGDAVVADAQNMSVDKAVEVSADEENKVVAENVAVATGEEGLKGESVNEYDEKGGINLTKDMDSQDIIVSEDKILDERGKNGVGDPSAVVGSSKDETQVLTLAQETTDEAKETNGSGEDILQDFKTEKVGVLCDEVWNPGIETTVPSSSTVTEDSNVETQVAEEEAKVTSNDETRNLRSEAALGKKHGSDGVEGGMSPSRRDSDSTEHAIANTTSKPLDGNTKVAVHGKGASMDRDITCGAALEEKQGSDVVDGGISSSEKDAGSTKEDVITNTISNSLDGHAQVAADANIASTNNKDISCGAEKHCSDVVEDNVYTSENDSDLTENNNAFANTVSKPLEGHKQIAVDGKVVSMDNEDITCSNIEGMDTDAFNENFCFSVEELQAPVETVNGSTENHYDAFADSQSSQQPTQLVAGGDVVAPANKTLVNPEKDKKLIIGEFRNQSMYGDPSQVHSNVEPEMGVDESVTDTKQASLQKEKDEVGTAHKSIGKDQELKLEMPLDVSAASNVASNTRQLMDSQEQVSHVDKLGRDERKLVEQGSEDEKVSPSTNTDPLVVYERRSAVVNRDKNLSPSVGIDMPEEWDCHQKAKDVSEIEADVRKVAAADEHVPDSEKVGFQEGQQMEVEEQDTDSEEPKTSDEKSAKQAVLNPGSTVKAHQATYQLPPDDEGEFAVSDLVWGKVRSHPWWPGQIFDPLDASEKAMKYYKKDCFFVAYFGDRTFAWNEASLLKPFRSHFLQVEKQSNSETFQNAVNCALEEVSRRVEFGLACSCIPSDAYDKIKCQVVQNTGIRQESSIRDDTDKSLGADLFEPGKLLEFTKALAQSTVGGADRLDLVIAKSQLLSFYRLKGYSQLPEFQFCSGWSENADTLNSEGELITDTSLVHKDDGQISSGQEILQVQRSSYHKRKHNLKDTMYPRKKERSLTELMVDSWDSLDYEIGPDGKASNKLLSPSSGKKRRGPDSFADDSGMLEGRKTISLAKVSTPVSLPKPSFKIGECIRRVASQMTGSPSILKSNSQKADGSSDGHVGDGFDVQHSEDADMKRMAVPTDYSSLDELLSQLYVAASDPLKGYSFLTVIVSFFSDFRNAVIMEQHEKVGGKRRQASVAGSPETFEFEDMNDTYWTDRVIQNGSEEQPPRKSRKRDNQLALVDSDKPINRSNSRKRYSDGIHGLSAEKPVTHLDENAPAELVMHFPVVDCVPSETSLIKMFRRFGPLKESETEIDKPTNRARVVFKKCSDAEAAYGSAPKFNIFGSVLVNYQLNYTITMPFKTEPVVSLPGEEDATLFLQY